MSADDKHWRKKPVVIEAIRYVPHENCAEVAAFLGIAHDSIACQQAPLNARFLIDTLEGQMECSPGDWIIKGVKGEFYPCKPDIFEATYEPARTPPPSTAASGETPYVTARMNVLRERAEKAERELAEAKEHLAHAVETCSAEVACRQKAERALAAQPSATELLKHHKRLVYNKAKRRIEVVRSHDGLVVDSFDPPLDWDVSVDGGAKHG